jgi:hypothetical protein
LHTPLHSRREEKLFLLPHSLCAVEKRLSKRESRLFLDGKTKSQYGKRLKTSTRARTGMKCVAMHHFLPT